MGRFDDLKNTGGGILENKKIDTPTAGKKKQRRRDRKTEKAKNTPAISDIVTTAGGRADMLPASVDDVNNILPVFVSEWIAVHAVNDLRKASPLVFNALCMDVGKIIKESRILKDKTRTAAGACVASTCNRYNPRAILSLYDIFVRFCAECDKIPFVAAFAYFSGVSASYLEEYKQILTSSGFGIAKKTHETELQAIRQKTAGDTVGRIAILNNEYYNNGGGGNIQDEQNNVVDLPSVNAFSLIEERPPE